MTGLPPPWDDPQPPWVDPASIPELGEILRRRLLSKVRIFEGWCENGDRLLQVVKVQGRPLALAKTAVLKPSGHPLLGEPRAAHRAGREAAWLDLRLGLYFEQLLSAQCQHEHLPVPLIWLRKQVQTGVSKCVITQAVRFEMEK